MVIDRQDAESATQANGRVPTSAEVRQSQATMCLAPGGSCFEDTVVGPQLGITPAMHAGTLLPVTSGRVLAAVGAGFLFPGVPVGDQDPVGCRPKNLEAHYLAFSEAEFLGRAKYISTHSLDPEDRKRYATGADRERGLERLKDKRRFLNQNKNVKVMKTRDGGLKVTCETSGDGYAFANLAEVTSTDPYDCLWRQLILKNTPNTYDLGSSLEQGKGPPLRVSATKRTPGPAGTEVDWKYSTRTSVVLDRHADDCPSNQNMTVELKFKIQATVPRDEEFGEVQALVCIDWWYKWDNLASDGQPHKSQSDRNKAKGKLEIYFGPVVRGQECVVKG